MTNKGQGQVGTQVFLGRWFRVEDVALFCDVALPVPLDRVFTYAVNEAEPAVGARVIVPFGGQRLMGVVVRVHDDAPEAGVEVKPVQTVMDAGALLDGEQMELARWIAGYYCAPLGEVLRGMLPLAAEVKRQFTYRISEQGKRVLYEGAAKGASRRSRLTAEEQNREYAVLNYLEAGEGAKAGALRSATGAGRGLLEGMVRKKWLVREAVAAERDARRVRKVAVMVEGEGVAGVEGSGKVGCAEAHPNDGEAVVRMGHTTDNSSHPEADGAGVERAAGRRLPKLNEGQLAVLAELASVGGRLDVQGSAGAASAAGGGGGLCGFGGAARVGGGGGGG